MDNSSRTAPESLKQARLLKSKQISSQSVRTDCRKSVQIVIMSCQLRNDSAAPKIGTDMSASRYQSSAGKWKWTSQSAFSSTKFKSLGEQWEARTGSERIVVNRKLGIRTIAPEWRTPDCLPYPNTIIYAYVKCLIPIDRRQAGSVFKSAFESFTAWRGGRFDTHGYL